MSKVAWYVVVALSAVVVVGALYAVDPSTTRIFPPCVWKSITGWDCPGCGSTRATHQLLRGNVSAAFRFNPLLVVGLPVGVAIWLVRRKAAKSPDQRRRETRRWAVLLVAVGVAFAIWRNC